MEQERPALPEKIKGQPHHWCWVTAVALVLLVLGIVWAMKAQGNEEDSGPLPVFDTQSHAEMVNLGGGRMDVRFQIDGVQTMEIVGVESVRVYGSVDGQRWTPMQDWDWRDYPFLMAGDTDSHQGQLSVYGTPGRYYKALVIVWVKGTTGSQSRSIWTPAIQA